MEIVESGPEQEEMTYAVVEGVPVTDLPRDLYIPPDALEIFLDTFEGPLDLLLYLIRRQNLDILNIPVAEITAQYIGYVEMMSEMRFELAAEYLVMSAMLAEIKSRMLLPRPADEEGEEIDPRAELVRRLQQYERFKQAAEDIDALPQVGRDIHVATAVVEAVKVTKEAPKVELDDVVIAFREVLQRAKMFNHHHITMEPLSVRARMSDVLSGLNAEKFTEFKDLFQVEEGRAGVVVTFLAILELVKESLVDLVQTEPFAPIHVKVASAKEGVEFDAKRVPGPKLVADASDASAGHDGQDEEEPESGDSIEYFERKEWYGIK